MGQRSKTKDVFIVLQRRYTVPGDDAINMAAGPASEAKCQQIADEKNVFKEDDDVFYFVLRAKQTITIEW